MDQEDASKIARALQLFWLEISNQRCTKYSYALWGRIVRWLGADIEPLGDRTMSEFSACNVLFSSLDLVESKYVQGHSTEARLRQLASLELSPSWLVACVAPQNRRSQDKQPERANSNSHQAFYPQIGWFHYLTGLQQQQSLPPVGVRARACVWPGFVQPAFH